MAMLPGMAMATATVNHSFTPATISQGDESNYTIEIVNDNVGSGLADVNLTSLLTEAGALPKPNISIVAPGVTANTCGGTVTANAGGTAVVLTGGTVPAATGIGAANAGRCLITVRVSSTTTGGNQTVVIPANTTPTSSTAGLVFTESGVPNRHNDTAANATMLVTSLQPPMGSKSFSPSPSYVGLPTRLTITLSNPNSSHNMPLTSFTDTLPAGMVVAPAPNASANCSGTGSVNDGAVAATAGGGSVTLTGGTIGQSGTCVVEVDVVVSSASSPNNTVGAGAIGNTRGLTSPEFSRSLTVLAPVAASKTFSPTTVPVGSTATMTIVITNNGAVALTGTAFNDIFPSSNLELVSVDPPVCTSGMNGTATANTGVSPHRLEYSGGTVAANGGTCTVTAQVRATAEAQYTNALPANAITNAEGIGSPAVSANLQAYAQLQVSKTVSPASVAPGQWATFSVDILNYAPGSVTNATFTDSLPMVGSAPNERPMELDPSALPSGCGFTFTSSGTNPVVLSGTGGTIPAASGTTPGACTVTFRARPPANAVVNTTFTNTLPTNSAVTGTGSGGTTIVNTNTSSVNLPVIDAVDLSKAFSPNSIAVGQTSLLTITVFNRTVNPLTGIAFTDTLPAGLVLAANPDAQTMCAGALQAFPGDNKVTLSGGTVSSRPAASTESSCTVTVRVTSTTPSPVAYTNTIAPANFTSSAGTIPGNRSANLAITAGLTANKQFQPAGAAQGGVVRATVTVTNQTTGALTNVSINDDGLAGGLTVANPANAATSCGGSPSITANPGATGVRLDGATLPAGGSCDLSFDVLATGAGPWENTLGVGKVTSAEGPTNSQAVTRTLTQQSASLALNKQFSPLIVTGNQPSTLTIDVVNTSVSPISKVSFTDVFPQGILVYSTPNAQTTCPGGTVTATPGSGQVSLTGAQLGAGNTCQVTVTVTSVAFLNLTNTIPAGAVSSQGGYTNATPTSATLSTLQGLGVSKGFEPAYVAPGAVSRLKIRLVNTFDPNIVNPTVLTGVSYTDQLPSGLVFAAVPNAVSTCTGAQIDVDQGSQAVTLTNVTLAPGSSCDLEVNVTAAAAGQYLNRIPANTVTTNQGVTNSLPGEATLNVVTGPNISKSFATSPVKVGDRTELIVTVTNTANVALTGVALTDNLPPDMAVANPSDSSTTCAGGSVTALPGAVSLSLAGATVPANDSCTFRAFVVASKAGSFTNTIGQGAITSQQGLTNGNPASAPLQVLAQPGISKSFTPAQIAAGGTSTLRIRLDNTNATPITLTSALVDALPGNVFVAASPNINGNLGGAVACPGTVTAAAGAISLTYANGATIPAGGCTISVDVTSSVTGSYLNTIAAGQLKTSAGDNPEPANATLGVGQPAAPTVNKSFNPATIDQGATSTLTITLGNPNATALTLASAMTDTLPTNVLVAATPNIGGTCTVGSVTAAAGGNTVVYAQNATIPPAGCTITVNVTSNVAGAYTNTIPASGLSTVEAGGNPTPANAGLVVRAPGAPTVQKAFSPTTINQGGVSTLTITLGNPNATTATLTAGNDLVDTLPANVVVATPPALGGTCSGVKEATAGGTTVTYKAGGTIPANGSCTITVNVTSAVSGSYVNTIAAGGLKTNLGDNGAPATASLLVNPGQPPSVSKSFAPASIVAGQQSTLTISLGNGNAAAATLTADLVDSLPAGVTVANPASIAGTCTLGSVTAVPGSGSVAYAAGATIPAGGCSIQVRVTASVTGTYTNTIAAGALQTDVGSNVVPATAALTVTSTAPGSIASIAGTVYHDRNDNGVINSGEEGIAGVEIRLLQGGSIVATTTTDANGHYSFTNLVPGTYTVVEVQPSGWNDGKDTVGVGATGAPGTAGNDVISNVTLAGGDAATQYNFGELRPPVAASIPTLSEWALIVLSMLLGLMAWREAGVRRR
ncbi:IPTL-CTERM sorting domain-containing protein [Alicycliphilus denitrificans]|uniref:IPTL-CTERM sorting domain-containing protein n=1 Tax=Alicycliphilus denitrificans TaxID=179636 RepID=UPI001915BE0A|nr:IPTL-CTERM sorting domain-containing protein [Alicycliphilus denitrificans]